MFLWKFKLDEKLALYDFRVFQQHRPTSVIQPGSIIRFNHADAQDMIDTGNQLNRLALRGWSSFLNINSEPKTHRKTALNQTNCFI